MSSLNSYLIWLRKQLSELDQIYDNTGIEPMSAHAVYLAAARIAEEAGERAAKLGLPELHAKSLPLAGEANPTEVKTYLAECVNACEPAKSNDDWLTVADVADRLGVAPRTVYRLCE